MRRLSRKLLLVGFAAALTVLTVTTPSVSADPGGPWAMVSRTNPHPHPHP